MLTQITTPKWSAFQDSLAIGLDACLVVVDRDGAVVATHGPDSAHTAAGHARSAGDSYSAFLSDLDRQGPWNGSRILRDPSGRTVGVIPLVGGGYVVLVNLRRDGVEDVHAATFAERVHHVDLLYRGIGNAMVESQEIGHKALLLSAVEQLNQLILELLGSGPVDFSRVLDLAASSLVILLDATAAWSLVRFESAGCEGVVRGTQAEALQQVRADWEAGTEDIPPGRRIRLYQRGLGEQRQAVATIRSHLCAVSIGTLGALTEEDDDSIRAALAALVTPVAIAGEIVALRRLLQRQLDGLLEALRHAVIVVTEDRRMAMFNPAGRSLLSSLGVRLSIGEPVFGKGLSAAMEAALLDQLHGTDREFDSCSGHFLSWSTRPLRSEAGTLSGVLMVVEDVTENATFRARAQDWEKLIIAGQMAAAMAHEIRSPLAAAIGAVQLWQMKNRDTGGNLLVRLHGELARMNEILTSYLASSKPGALGTQSQLDLREPLREVSFLLATEAAFHRVGFDMRLPEGPFPTVMANANGLKQVVLNLAKNAIEAMAGGGRLDLTLDSDGHWVTITLLDTGPGISEEISERAFKPFFTTKAHGNGLGLSVTRELVERMRGTVKLIGPPGGGATAVVTLPVCATDRLAAGQNALGV